MEQTFNPEDWICKLCSKVCDEGDFCYGCKEYICGDCENRLNAPMGKHEWEAHL